MGDLVAKAKGYAEIELGREEDEPQLAKEAEQNGTSCTTTDDDRAVAIDEHDVRMSLASIASGTQVIVRRIKPQHLAAYKQWLDRIGSVCATQPGFINRQVFPPASSDYRHNFWTVVLSFESGDTARVWMASDACSALVAEAEPWCEGQASALLSSQFFDSTSEVFGMNTRERSGTVGTADDGAPVPGEGGNKPTSAIPHRQSLVVLVNLYPVVLCLSLLLPLLYGKAKVPPPVQILISVGIGVPALTYFMVPTSMRFMGPWAFGLLPEGDHMDWGTTVMALLWLGLLCLLCTYTWPAEEKQDACL